MSSGQGPHPADRQHRGPAKGELQGRDRPQSALNLRLALASFGLICTGVLLWLAIRYSNMALAIVSCVLLAVTVTDLVAIQIRRKRRRKREPGADHSLFE